MGAQVPNNATSDDLAKIKADAELRQQTYKALKEAAEAKKAYEASLDAANQTLLDQSAAAKAAKDLSDAKTAAAGAQKAQSDAELAALKAKFGDFTGSGLTGSVDMGTGAGSAEAMLLGAAALNEIATKLATQIKVDVGGRSVVLTTPANVPDFQALLAFNAQFSALTTTMSNARGSAPIESFDNSAVRVESVAGVGLALDAASKLLSYFKTDYKFTGIEIAASDAMLLNALASQLHANNRKVRIPALYDSAAFDSKSEVLTQMSNAFGWLQEAKRNVKFFEAAQAEFEKKVAATPSDTDANAKLQRAKNGVVVWKAASDSVEAWSKQVSTADDKGNTPLVAILRQSAFKRQLNEGDALVVVQLHKMSGTAYTEKNLWSSLGLTPFYVMGGAVAGYIAVDGKDGNIIGSRLIPLHGGYHSVSKIQKLVNGE